MQSFGNIRVQFLDVLYARGQLLDFNVSLAVYQYYSLDWMSTYDIYVWWMSVSSTTLFDIDVRWMST